jgi:putative peptidoglycan lipid II flippase
VKHLLLMMIPVALGLGLINFDLLINSTLGLRVDQQAPAAIAAAFRLYMLPQGIFSVAIATVLFPSLSRLAARGDLDGMRSLIGGGMRQILALLLPAAALFIVLSTPITRLIYEGGNFGPSSVHNASVALSVFALTLPLNGLNLLFTRTFFALKQPWTTTWLALASLVVDLIVSLALYKPFGIGGVVFGTVAANAAIVAAQTYVLRDRLRGSLELVETVRSALMIGAAALLLAGSALLIWTGLDRLLGRGFFGELTSVGFAIVLGSIAYVAALNWMGVSEGEVLTRFAGRFTGRFARS